MGLLGGLPCCRSCSVLFTAATDGLVLLKGQFAPVWTALMTERFTSMKRGRRDGFQSHRSKGASTLRGSGWSRRSLCWPAVPDRLTTTSAGCRSRRAATCSLTARSEKVGLNPTPGVGVRHPAALNAVDRAEQGGDNGCSAASRSMACNRGTGLGDSRGFAESIQRGLDIGLGVGQGVNLLRRHWAR